MRSRILLTLLLICSWYSQLNSAVGNDLTDDLLLEVSYTDGKLFLSWEAPPEQECWDIQWSADPWFWNPQFLQTTTETAVSFDLPQASSRFYRIVPVTNPVTPPADELLEDFEINMPVLTSWSDQDEDPEAWDWDDSNPFEGDHCLLLYGNSYKAQELGERQLFFHTVMSIAARCENVANRQMVGFADSANVIWYVLWGSSGGYADTPGQSGQAEVCAYQGWFPTEEWHEFMLPVGQDWQGKFGYLPRLLQVIYANDCDSNNGEVRYDLLSDVSMSQLRRPTAAFVADVLETVGDSCQVTFTSLATPRPLTHSWNFGNNTSSSEIDPTVWLPTARTHRVTLLVEDAIRHYDYTSLEVVTPQPQLPRTALISCVGDVMMARAYEENGGIIPEQGVEAIYEGVHTVWRAADLMLINLECPLTTSNTQHPTKTIIFRSHPDNVAGLLYGGVDYASLANNHAFDYMSEGLLETRTVLREAGIAFSGADSNSFLARQPSFLSANGLAIGVLAASDRGGYYNNLQPFLDAAPSRPGFASWTRAEMQATIPRLREQVDWLMLQVHSGYEYSHAPVLRGTSPARPLEGIPWDPNDYGLFARDLLPDQSERSHRQEAIDLGADLVITHHPHILQGLELYNDRLIAHSLGNFVMDLSYVETMTTAQLDIHLEEDQLAGITIQPAYIARYIPGFARGELAGSILDHITALSLSFDTWVVRQPGADTAWVVLDTLAVNWSGSTFNDTLALFDYDDHRLSRPHRLQGEGYPAWFTLDEFLPDAEWRVGRNILWWGNMEDEGAPQWDINSSGEWYDNTISHTGLRSLRLQESNGDDVQNYFVSRVPLDTGYDYSIMGWMQTSNAGLANLQMRYYQARSGGGAIGTELALPELSGDNEWSQVWTELTLPEQTNFYSVRHSLTAGTGTADCWFDDEVVIQWEPWQDFPADFRLPNDYDYIQLRAPLAPADLPVEYRREWIELR
ncbi:MAG: CapA family protein [Candidatus Delongbacteria bacterium]|nr:CapA family protein [Candidatus Delongbacteria bacterium]